MIPSRTAFWLLFLLLTAPLAAQDGFRDPELRRARVESLAAGSEAAAAAALEWARSLGLRPRGRAAGSDYELVGLEDGRPVYLMTTNDDAAISTNAAAVRGQPIFGSPLGATQRVGVWDSGRARETHQELSGRVVLGDASGIASHSTHVAGTIGAAGVVAAARGMAPAVTIHSYGWGSDEAEAAALAAAVSGDDQRIKISNHSYGVVKGWAWGGWSGTTGWHWFGSWGEAEDRTFGRYGSGPASWDQICHDAPYYLPFWSAGNDRNDGPPDVGETFFYPSGGWQSKAWDPAVDPGGDGADGGYDTIGGDGCAKNVVTVGAVSDAVSGGARSVAAASMTSFSGWGPTDDGRIKPDVVANGASLYSSTSASDSSYGSSSGTSMSSPNAAGSAVLLHEIHAALFGADMRAATLKGLLIHTADDLGNPGPDYSFGWGLIDVLAAAELLQAQAAEPFDGLVAEERLDLVEPLKDHPLEVFGGEPLVVTICWTDPAGASVSGLDDPTPSLVSDLDLRIVRESDGAVFEPWILDPAFPSAAATTGDNTRDNVEQVRIAAPLPGDYRFVVTHEGQLQGGVQEFSVLISGARRRDVVRAEREILLPGCTGLFGLPMGLDANDPELGADFILDGYWAPANAVGLVAVSVGAAAPGLLPNGCPLWIDPAIAWIADSPATDSWGAWTSVLPLPDDPTLEGVLFRLQGFFPDPASNWGWTGTPGLEGVAGY